MQTPKPKIKVLFLCTGNSCRSQMAEGWARRLKGEAVEAYSAGVEPHGLNPHAVRVMREAGVDIAGQRSKHVDELRDVPLDYVVTVCGHAHESCPVFPGRAKVIHVGFNDPPRLAQGAKTEEEALGHYRRVRDEIREFIETGFEQKLDMPTKGARVMMSKRPIALILCTGNSCRSQMAEGYLRKYQGERFDAHSAGTDPKSEVHPLAVRVMGEIGIDITAQFPKPLTQFLGREAVRHLIIVCDKAFKTCPRVWPGSFTRDYLPFEDPAEFEGTEAEALDKFREVRDQIREAMQTWAPSEPARA